MGKLKDKVKQFEEKSKKLDQDLTELLLEFETAIVDKSNQEITDPDFLISLLKVSSLVQLMGFDLSQSFISLSGLGSIEKGERFTSDIIDRIRKEHGNGKICNCEICAMLGKELDKYKETIAPNKINSKSNKDLN